MRAANFFRQRRFRFFACSLLAVAALVLFALPVQAHEEVGATVTVSAASRFQAKKLAESKAAEQAVINYIDRVSPGADASCVERMASDSASLVKRMTMQNLSFANGEAKASFRVQIDDSLINRRLEELGCGAQSGKASVTIVIMEEPPTIANISMILDAEDADGVRKLRGLGPFVVFYTSFQRAIRDAVIAQANKEGLQLTRLDTTQGMESYKVSGDDPLVGVYFDAATESFVINRKLVAAVRNRFASKNAIILYYRIDSLYFDQVERLLKAAISISLQDLVSGETKSVGSQEFAVTVPPKQPSVAIRDGLREVAANAASLLMNDAKKEARRMSSMAQARAEKQDATPGVVTLALDSKRTLYKIKQAMSSSMVQHAEIQGNSLVFQLAPGASLEDFVFGELYGVLEAQGLSIPEKNVKFQGKDVYISQ
ncbi:MAG: hypothetical protein PWQ57_1208 [Desulfovibrionales bacterium]|jgi:hypothetical protein|nr:hypothetical protein [Desulfovibrionales bacterium]